MKRIRGITKLPEWKEDELGDRLIFCYFCYEPFRECVTVIPGVGVIDGDTDVRKYKARYWHWGCIYDYEKMNKDERAEWRKWKKEYMERCSRILGEKPQIQLSYKPH